MDEKTKKSYDANYDMWSTDGPARLVGVFSSERDIAMSDWWHEYFLWKPIAKKQWKYNAKELWRLRDMHFSYNFYDVFYRPLIGPKNLWGGDACSLRTSCQTEYPMSATISILYQRDMASIYMKEFAKLQLECEELVNKTSELYEIVEASRKLSRIILTFGRSIAEGEKAERKIKKMNALIDRKMARVEEVRQLIMKEQQEG